MRAICDEMDISIADIDLWMDRSAGADERRTGRGPHLRAV